MADKSDFRSVLDGMAQIKEKAKANGYAAAQVAPVAMQYLKNHGWSPDEFKAANSGASNSAAGPLMQGATFGYADELRGLGGAIKDTVMNGDNFGDAYQRNTAQERNSLDAYRQANPKTAMGLEFAGGVAPSILATMATGGGAAPATLGALAKQGAISGAVTGGIYGTGQGEGATDSLARGAVGAGLGGMLGAAAPVAVEGVKAAGRQIGNMLPGGEKRAADYLIQRTLQRDGIDPGTIVNKLDEAAALRKPATPADMGGENAQGLADLVSNAPGEGLQIAKTALETRARKGAERMTWDISTAFGSPKKAMEAITESEVAQKAAAAPLYASARSAPVPPAVWSTFEQESKRGFGPIALANAKKMIQAEFGVDDIAQAPRVAVIDAWKQAMDDQWSSMLRAGEKNGASKVRMQIDNVIPALDAAVPDYAAARAAYAGPAAFQDAVEEGKRISAKNYGPDDLAAWWGKATASERDGFRIGAASSLNAKVGNDASKLPDLTKHLRDPNMQAKIATVIDDPAALKKWQDSFAIEERMAETLALTKNSRTGYRLAAQADAADQGIAPETLAAILGNSQSLWSTASRLTGFVGRRVADTFNAKRNAEIARQMLETDPAAAAANFARLGAKPAASLASPAWGGIAGAQLGGNAAGALPLGTFGRPAEVPY